MSEMVLMVFTGFIASLCIALNKNKHPLRNAIFIAAPIFVLLQNIKMQRGSLVSEIEIADFGNGLSLAVLNNPNTIATLFLYVASGLWLFAAFYTLSYVQKNSLKKSTRFLALFTLAVSSAIGISVSANLLSLFIFYELLTIATWPLVAHKESQEAKKSARLYLYYTLSGASLMMLGIIMVWKYSGNVNFQYANGMLQTMPNNLQKITMAVLLIGSSVKAAVFPLHGWLPKAMVAPTPVSALLHAVAVVKAGVFTILIIIHNVIGLELFIQSGIYRYVLLLSGFTILYASIRACGEDNLKKRLAYSTIAHLSYIVYAGCFSLLAAALHFLAHALMKIVLFMSAGIIQTETGKKKISEMAGIGFVLPKTFSTFTIMSLGLIGLPPVVGFVSKFQLLGYLPDGLSLVYSSIFILSGMISAAYLLPIIIKGWFETTKIQKIKESGGMAVPVMIITLLACALTLMN
tara:strand:+ start:23799 stop:25184 length:1386 start_codon:yes stop_codon:yes gene_type:complete